MATYSEIQSFVKQKYGFTVKTCWIAHMKKMCGLDVKIAHNRQSLDSRINPCPTDKQTVIKDAFEHFGML